MTSDTMKIYGDNEVIIETNSPEELLIEEPLLLPSASEAELTEESWDSFQAQATDFLASTTQSIVAFFKSNRSLMTKLGWVFLAFLGIRILFAAVGAIDDIPLMSPLLKLIGLISVGQFVWRYLLKASDRQAFVEKIDQVKAEFLGS
jgi:CAAD domains of cyanobacterial aminoacyl-tRNA synthetase